MDGDFQSLIGSYLPALEVWEQPPKHLWEYVCLDSIKSIFGNMFEIIPEDTKAIESESIYAWTGTTVHVVKEGVFLVYLA